MARPRLDQLNASRTVGVTAASGGTPFGNGGNAQLDPWRVLDYLDLSWERYFGKKAYVAVQGFYKKLSLHLRPDCALRLLALPVSRRDDQHRALHEPAEWSGRPARRR